jgi:hypothetical protein
MDQMDQLVERARELSGSNNVEVLDPRGYRVRYVDKLLVPKQVLRIDNRVFVETVSDPDEWWMGEIEAGEIVVWGLYGRMEEAFKQH